MAELLPINNLPTRPIPPQPLLNNLEPLPNNPIQILSKGNQKKETEFSSLKYVCIALAITAIALAVLPFCFPVSIALFAIAGWYLGSAGIVELNRTASGTCLEKPAHLLHSIATEVNSIVTAACLFPLTLSKGYHRPRGNLKGQPILMINGFLSFGSTWDYQRRRLVEAGFGPIYTINVGSGGSIESYAKEIEKKVEQIKRETGRNDLALVCHSKGGLVGSYYATHLAATTEITDIVTIGSPFEGTKLAYLAPGAKDAKEMRPHSEFTQELKKSINAHPEILFHHIGSTLDEVVPLSSALREDDRSHRYVLNDLGHLGLIFSSRVADLVCQSLKKA